MERRKEDFKITQNIAPDVRLSKLLIFVGFITLGIDLLFSVIYNILVISVVYQETLDAILSVLNTIFNVTAIVGIILLIIGLNKIMKYFSGLIKINLQKTLIFLAIGLLYPYVISYLLNAFISPSLSVTYIVIHWINSILVIASRILIIFAVFKIRNVVIELNKLQPTYSTSYISFYPLIISNALLCVNSIIYLILDTLFALLPIYFLIMYIILILCLLVIGLGYLEIGLKFNQINEHEIANLVLITSQNQSILDDPFRPEDENIKNI